MIHRLASRRNGQAETAWQIDTKVPNEASWDWQTSAGPLRDRGLVIPSRLTLRPTDRSWIESVAVAASLVRCDM